MIACVRRVVVVLAVAALSSGCASISIDQPLDGSVNVKMPQPVVVTTQGRAVLQDPSVDGFDLSRYNGQNFQYVPQSTLRFVPPGQHSLLVAARDDYWGLDISRSSRFTVGTCTLCYACPVGQAHPVTGQCCDGGQCDSPAKRNFGSYLEGSQECQKETAPGSGVWLADLDCLSTGLAAVRGSTGGAALTLAVRFSPVQSGVLQHIQVPIRWQSGANSLQLWITADNANAPGAVLEARQVTNLPAQTLQNIDAPAHVFSVAHPQLTVGASYWLVLAAGAPDTKMVWSMSVDQTDMSMYTSPSYLQSSASTGLAGPWTKVGGSTLPEPRPAFEIDVR